MIFHYGICTHHLQISINMNWSAKRINSSSVLLHKIKRTYAQNRHRRWKICWKHERILQWLVGKEICNKRCARFPVKEFYVIRVRRTNQGTNAFLYVAFIQCCKHKKSSLWMQLIELQKQATLVDMM